MKFIDFLILLRHDILDACSVVKDSQGGWQWGRERTNAETRKLLQSLLDKHIHSAEKWGIYVVNRHTECPNKNHSGYLISKGRHGVKVYRDGNFIWTGEQLYQGYMDTVCPCDTNAKPTKHWVIQEFVIRKIGFSKRHGSFVDAIAWLVAAIDVAGDGKTRSAIRECLLMAVLRLTDGILPQTFDGYIASRKIVNY